MSDSGDEGTGTSAWRKVNRHRGLLAQRLTNTADIRRECRSCDLIEASEYVELENIHHQYRHNERLLTLLESTESTKVLSDFLDILSLWPKYSGLVARLRKLTGIYRSDSLVSGKPSCMRACGCVCVCFCVFMCVFFSFNVYFT